MSKNLYKWRAHFSSLAPNQQNAILSHLKSSFKDFVGKVNFQKKDKWSKEVRKLSALEEISILNNSRQEAIADLFGLKASTAKKSLSKVLKLVGLEDFNKPIYTKTSDEAIENISNQIQDAIARGIDINKNPREAYDLSKLPKKKFRPSEIIDKNNWHIDSQQLHFLYTFLQVHSYDDSVNDISLSTLDKKLKSGEVCSEAFLSRFNAWKELSDSIYSGSDNLLTHRLWDVDDKGNYKSRTIEAELYVFENYQSFSPEFKYILLRAVYDIPALNKNYNFINVSLGLDKGFHIFYHPTSQQVASYLGIEKKTLSSMNKFFLELGILKKISESDSRTFQISSDSPCDKKSIVTVEIGELFSHCVYRKDYIEIYKNYCLSKGLNLTYNSKESKGFDVPAFHKTCRARTVLSVDDEVGKARVYIEKCERYCESEHDDQLNVEELNRLIHHLGSVTNSEELFKIIKSGNSFAFSLLSQLFKIPKETITKALQLTLQHTRLIDQIGKTTVKRHALLVYMLFCIKHKCRIFLDDSTDYSKAYPWEIEELDEVFFPEDTDDTAKLKAHGMYSFKCLLILQARLLEEGFSKYLQGEEFFTKDVL